MTYLKSALEILKSNMASNNKEVAFSISIHFNQYATDNVNNASVIFKTKYNLQVNDSYQDILYLKSIQRARAQFLALALEFVK